MGDYYSRYKDIVDLIIYVVIAVVVSGLIPMYALFGMGGGEIAVNWDKIWTYWGLSFFLFIGISFGKLSEMLSKMSYKRYGKEGKIFRYIGWYGSILNDPEKSLLYFVSKGKIKIAGYKLFLVGLVIFSILGLYGVTQNTFLTELPPVEQQITPTSQAIFSVEPAGTEIWILVFGIGIIMSFFKWLQLRNKWDNTTYWAMVFPSCLVVGTSGWIGVHSLRYSGSEMSLVSVGIFGFVATILILLFATMILPWVFKDTHNLFHHLNDKFSDEKILIITGAVLFVLAIITIWILIKTKKQKVELGTTLPQKI